MCQPDHPCEHILGPVRAMLDDVVAHAIADLTAHVTTTAFHRLSAEGIKHLHDGLGTRDVSRIGATLTLALVAERLPEHQELIDAATMVRSTLMRRILAKPAPVPRA